MTGAGSGIGAACARALAAEGFGVLCADIDGALAEETAMSLASGSSRQLDVRSEQETEAAIKEAVAKHGPLEAVVAAAGILRTSHLVDTTIEEFETVLGVNTTGAFLTARCAARAMTRTGGGSIVLIGSMTSVRVSLPGQAAYATSKGGVLMLGKALAVDLAAAGIRVNVILPGVTDTPLGGLSKLDDEATEDLLSRVPSRRVAQPEDVAAVAAFLASPAARHVTGAAIPVDGGQLALTSPFPFV